MNKSELIAKVSSITGIPKQTISTVIDEIINAVVQAVCTGEKVQIIDFVAIERRKRKQRTGRDPKTGNEILIPEADVPVFSAGKAFKDKVRESGKS